jgi:hypothetical protein
MDEDIPLIELKLKFPDIDNYYYYLISTLVYLLIGLIISTLIYLYIHILAKLKIFHNYREYRDDIDDMF